MLFNNFQKVDREKSLGLVDSPKFDFLSGKLRVVALAAFIGLSAISCAENGVVEGNDDVEGDEVLQERLLTLESYIFTDTSLIAQFDAPSHELSVSVYFDDEYQFEGTIKANGDFRIDNLPASVQKVSVALGEETVEMVRDGVDPLLGS